MKKPTLISNRQRISLAALSLAIGSNPYAGPHTCELELFPVKLKNTAIHTGRLSLSGDSHSIVSRQTMAVRIDKTQRPEWTQENQERFHALAVKEALETISEDEMIELEELSLLRDALLDATSPEEYFQRLVQERKMAAVLRSADLLMTSIGIDG